MLRQLSENSALERKVVAGLQYCAAWCSSRDNDTPRGLVDQLVRGHDCRVWEQI